MNKKIFLYSLISVVIVIAVFTFYKTDKTNATGETNQPLASLDLSGTGQSANVGTINFSGKAQDGSSYGVSLSSVSGSPGIYNLVGYAWSDNVGWVQFGDFSPTAFPIVGGSNVKLDLVNSTVTGIARVLAPAGELTNNGRWDGWLNFNGIATDGSTYGVSVDKTTNPSQPKMVGYAWGSDVLGWVKIDVNLPPEIVPNISVTLTANPAIITTTSQTTTMLSWVPSPNTLTCQAGKVFTILAGGSTATPVSVQGWTLGDSLGAGSNSKSVSLPTLKNNGDSVTYGITCSDSMGNTTGKTTTVTRQITPTPTTNMTVTLTPASLCVLPNKSFTLGWDTKNPPVNINNISCTATWNGVTTSVGPSGSITLISPNTLNTSYDYTITCKETGLTKGSLPNNSTAKSTITVKSTCKNKPGFIEI